MRRSTVFALVGAVLLLSATSAMAAGVDMAQSNTSMYSLLRLIQNASNQWARRLHDYALWLLGCLAVIQLVWTFAPLVMRGAELGDILHELVKFILVIGFFYAMLESQEMANSTRRSMDSANVGARTSQVSLSARSV